MKTLTTKQFIDRHHNYFGSWVESSVRMHNANVQTECLRV